MIKPILTICAAMAAGAAGMSLAHAQQAYPQPPGAIYSSDPPPYPRSAYPAEERNGAAVGAPDFDRVDDDEGAPSSVALSPPGPIVSPDDPRYGQAAGAPVYSDRGAPTGPILSPDDPRYGRPMGAPPVYSAAPTGPVLSPDDPRYGRPAGPPPVIYADRPGVAPGSADDDGGLRPPGPVGPGGATGSVQSPAMGQDGRPAAVAALPPEEQPETGPAQLAPNLRRQEVAFVTKEPAGTIVVDTPNTYLYYVLGGGRAIRYGVRVGRDGFTWTGVQKITKKSEWPDWFPPSEMIERQPYLPRFMAGGPGNPLGARAMYLGSTVYRIHGTNQPSTIGKFVSSGCIGMLNDDVSDLFDRVKVGTRVVVLPGGPPPGMTTASAAPMPGAAGGPVAQPYARMPSGPLPGTEPTVVPPLPAPVTVR
ncbi:L,D-transpeptidase family protein [Bradyrhizobium sp.]|uniref:L,D-transpeptidase n=1 Tax=Bradyrhizobium sp. TaxID=376 RepID=UPI003C5A75F8